MEGGCGQAGMGCWEVRVYLFLYFFNLFLLHLFKVWMHGHDSYLFTWRFGLYKKRVLRMGSGGGTSSSLMMLILSF